ncbi:P-loop containing nucleoside triphosphate hydrolase protein [Hypoxylon cercidicola]|nr:P-loop containing nucleoside triphosphate hydrolase protein [Hypoxylon cercidicola]
MLFVSGLLYGYSLRERTWGVFVVDRVSSITWNKTIFDSLVMEKTIKDVIYQLVVAHGIGASKIHSRLSKIFKLAGHWEAVVLLEEADVFLAQHTTTDIENAIVSVFLRELEYYQGILILTTNQAEVVGEAFQSRIHLYHQYPSLDAAARLKIWENFMTNARQYKSIKVDVDQADLLRLAETPLNGRQIKNTVSIAVKIATITKPHVITADSLKDTAKLLQNSQFLRRLGEVIKPPPGVLTTVLPGLAGICSGVLDTLWLLRNGSFRR